MIAVCDISCVIYQRFALSLRLREIRRTGKSADVSVMVFDDILIELSGVVRYFIKMFGDIFHQLTHPGICRISEGHIAYYPVVLIDQNRRVVCVWVPWRVSVIRITVCAVLVPDGFTVVF